MNKNKNIIPDFLPDYYRKPTDLTPTLEVCYAMAEKMHERHLRDKVDFDIPYMTHINVAYHLLACSGVTDEATLGACLLHDVIEDYKDDGKAILQKGTLDQAIENELLKEGIEHNYAHRMSGQIAGYVDEVSDLEQFPSNNKKRNAQTSHIRHASNSAKLIKIADQSSSLLDDIICESRRSDEKLREFAYKARDAISAASEPFPINENLFALARVLFRYDVHILNTPTEDRAELRKSFSLEDAQHLGDYFKDTPVDVVGFDNKIGYLSEGKNGNGIGGIYFDKQGKIGAFTIRNDSNDAIEAADILRETLEWGHLEANDILTNEMLRVVRTGITETYGDAGYVTLHINPPMPASEFKIITRDIAPLDKRMEERWKNRPTPETSLERL